MTKDSISQLPRKGRRVWPIDCGPATNIDCRVHVGMAGVPVRRAQETRLRLQVRRLTMPTGITHLSGIRRVDVDHPDTSKRRFVGNEGAELEEAPRVQHTPMAFRNRSLRAFADALQIFQSDPARSASEASRYALTIQAKSILMKPIVNSGRLISAGAQIMQRFLTHIGNRSARTSARVLLNHISRCTQEACQTVQRPLGSISTVPARHSDQATVTIEVAQQKRIVRCCGDLSRPFQTIALAWHDAIPRQVSDKLRRR
jgi:hypothetical protein